MALAALTNSVAVHCMIQLSIAAGNCAETTTTLMYNHLNIYVRRHKEAVVYVANGTYLGNLCTATSL
jgi:hypothetical protein